MSTIDKQRVAAVRKLEAMGYTFAAGDWMQPTNDAAPLPITDALHSLLVARAGELVGSTEGSDEERELASITDAIDANEAVRWPGGKISGASGAPERSRQRQQRCEHVEAMAIGELARRDHDVVLAPIAAEQHALAQAVHHG